MLLPNIKYQTASLAILLFILFVIALTLETTIIGMVNES